MKYQEFYDKKLKAWSEEYNPEAGLIEENMLDWGRGYHSRYSGIVHKTRENTSYATAIIVGKARELYERAASILEKVVDAQDTREDSKTFGLWGYYFEESLDDMRAPDYNWSDFISKDLIAALMFGENILNEELKAKLRTAIHNAAVCSIRRDVAPDYTNISVMSSFSIVAAGEILGKPEFVEIGRKRLKRFLEYIEFNGNYSEYNSTGYSVITLEELSRILTLVKDPETLKTAQKLLEVGWKLLAEHWNTSLKQHTPPYYRAYYDVDVFDEKVRNQALPAWLYCGTDGKVGEILSEHRISFDTIFYHQPCPEHILPLFEPVEERVVDEVFYKKNDFRPVGYEYCTISNYDCPDLRAYSYMTKDYSMGSFDVIDGWNQRRSSMVIWGKEDPSYIRIRCMNNAYDFCSGMVYTDQYKNRMLSQLGFVNDRGDFHFNLDPIVDGTIKTKELYFKIEFGGKEVSVTRDDNVFTYESQGVRVAVDIRKWRFDGQEAEIIFNEEDKCIELMCYRGEEKELNLTALKETYGVVVMTVNDKENYEIQTTCLDEKAETTVKTSEGELYVSSPTNVMGYGQALLNYKTSKSI